MARKQVTDCVVSLEKLRDTLGRTAGAKSVTAMNDTLGTALGVRPDALALMMKAIADPKAANRLMDQSVLMKGEGLGFEIFVNNMIAGFGTHVLNFKANTFMIGLSFAKSVARTGSAAVSSAVTLNPTRVMEEGQMLLDSMGTMRDTVSDIMKMTFTRGKGWQSMDMPLEQFGTHDWLIKARAGGPQAGTATQATAGTNPRVDRSFQATTFGVNPDNALGKGIDFAGAIVNAPGEALRHSDLAAKSINYLTEVRYQARIRANELGTTSNERQRFYSIMKDNPPQDIIQMGADKANRNTFTNKLDPVTSKVRAMLQIPFLRWATPFFRTLVNITKVGIDESALGEIGRMQKGLLSWKGDNYFQVMKENSARGDAARAQLASSTAFTYAGIAAFDTVADRDGYGVTGYRDMSQESERLAAQNIAPAFSYRFENGMIFEFADIEPLRTVVALHSGVREALDYVELYKEDGTPTSEAAQLMQIAVTPMEHLFGDFFAMESFSKVNHIMEVLRGAQPGREQEAIDKVGELAATFLIPRYMKDVNKAGAKIANMSERTASQQFFDDEMRRAHGFLEGLKQQIPGLSKSIGRPTTLWGEVKKPMRGLTMETQSSTVTGSREPDVVDFAVQDLGVEFIDNPRKLSFNFGGASVTLPINSKQSEDFMQMSGEGLKESLTELMQDPSFATAGRDARKSFMELTIRAQQKAATAMMLDKYPELAKLGEQRLIKRAEIQSGELDRRGSATDALRGMLP